MSGPSTFGELLRQYRLTAGFTQEALAERAGISADAIAALERGRRAAPRLDTTAQLARALELDGPSREQFLMAGTAAQRRDAPLVAVPSSGPSALAQIPVPTTPLLGREHEEAALTDLLQGGARLVTLTGPGGVGKTRLAVDVATALQQSYADGGVYVDLSPVDIVGLVPCTIALALGLQETGPQYGRDLLMEQLRAKHLLLVLDNFEQVVDAASVVGDLLTNCPRLTLLLTSRVALRLRAEQQFPLASLAVPDTNCTSPEAVFGYPSVQLFVSRAQTVQPDFAVDNDNAAAIGEICRRLDGLPLAIELAASQIRLLPPAALAARLQRPLSVLSPGLRDLPARQQTLRATLDWSYGLLLPAEQGCLARLSVFAGGFGLEATEAVCYPDASVDWLNTIDSLVSSNLLQQIERHGEPRFVMSQTVRDYAHEQLELRGEAEWVQHLHALYYTTRAEEILPRFRTDQTSWLDEWAQEHENLRAALHWAWDSDAALGLRLAGFVWRFWLLRGHLKEARTLLEGLLERAPTAAPATRAEAAAGAASLVLAQGDIPRAVHWGQIARDLYQEDGNDAGTASMLNLLGTAGRPLFPFH